MKEKKKPTEKRATKGSKKTKPSEKRATKGSKKTKPSHEQVQMMCKERGCEPGSILECLKKEVDCQNKSFAQCLKMLKDTPPRKKTPTMKEVYRKLQMYPAQQLWKNMECLTEEIPHENSIKPFRSPIGESDSKPRRSPHTSPIGESDWKPFRSPHRSPIGESDSKPRRSPHRSPIGESDSKPFRSPHRSPIGGIDAKSPSQMVSDPYYYISDIELRDLEEHLNAQPLDILRP